MGTETPAQAGCERLVWLFSAMTALLPEAGDPTATEGETCAWLGSPTLLPGNTGVVHSLTSPPDLSTSVLLDATSHLPQLSNCFYRAVCGGVCVCWGGEGRWPHFP